MVATGLSAAGVVVVKRDCSDCKYTTEKNNKISKIVQKSVKSSVFGLWRPLQSPKQSLNSPSQQPLPASPKGRSRCG